MQRVRHWSLVIALAYEGSALRTPMDASILKLQRQGKVAAIANRLLD